MMVQQAASYGSLGSQRIERIGLMLIVIAMALAQCPVWRCPDGSRWPIGAYFAAVAWLLGAGLSAGAIVRWMACQGRSLGNQTAAATIAWSHLRRPSIRHRFAVAALASAVAMTAGMAVMVASFDHTMRGWVERSMKADIYVSSAGAQSASSTQQISVSAVDAMRTDPDIAEVACLQARQVIMPTGPVWVLGVEPAFVTSHDVYAWVVQPPADWWKESVIVNESFAERFNVHANEDVTLPTPHGNMHCHIAGIYADYGNERGSITMARVRFQQVFDADMLWRVALMLKPGADGETVRARLQAAHPCLSIFTQAHLRSEALRIFQQTFSVTYALEVIGVVVAVVGLGLALASLLLERREELHTLRSIGMTSREIARSSALEGLGLASSGTIVGLLAGWWLGWLLIYRINKQCFGWTLSFYLPWWQLIALGVAVIVSGVLVAMIVARRIVHEDH
jgi:putative ABC transport system permease protein